MPFITCFCFTHVNQAFFCIHTFITLIICLAFINWDLLILCNVFLSTLFIFGFYSIVSTKWSIHCKYNYFWLFIN